MLISITLRTTVGPAQSSYEIIMFVANEPQQCCTNVAIIYLSCAGYLVLRWIITYYQVARWRNVVHIRMSTQPES